MLWHILIGFVSGVISGMGIGGGTVLIPALGILTGMEQKAAQSINLMYFIPTATIAVITHRKKGNIETEGTAKLILFGLVGAGAGAMLAMWIDAGTLKRIFGFFLLAMGLYEFKKAHNEVKKNN